MKCKNCGKRKKYMCNFCYAYVLNESVRVERERILKLIGNPKDAGITYSEMKKMVDEGAISPNKKIRFAIDFEHLIKAINSKKGLEVKVKMKKCIVCGKETRSITNFCSKACLKEAEKNNNRYCGCDRCMGLLDKQKGIKK